MTHWQQTKVPTTEDRLPVGFVFQYSCGHTWRGKWDLAVFEEEYMIHVATQGFKLCQKCRAI